VPLIEIDGIKVAYEDAGAGLPIVFIPGLVGTKEWFVNQSKGLRERCRIISYDLRAAEHRNYNLDLLTDDLSLFLSALRLDSAVIAGHAFGAMITQRFAISHREQTDGLILISAFPSLPDVSRESIIEWMAPGEIQVETPFQTVLKKLFHLRPPSRESDTEGMDWLTTHSARLTRSMLDHRISMVQHFDSTEWLPDIEAPTLVITGAHDREPFLHGAQMLYERIPTAQLEVVEDGDHYCFYTRHDFVNALIDEFVAERVTSL
jgi:pimeloyl-ACP methyl ester carboxylesterase